MYERSTKERERSLAWELSGVHIQWRMNQEPSVLTDWSREIIPLLTLGPGVVRTKLVQGNWHQAAGCDRIQNMDLCVWLMASRCGAVEWSLSAMSASTGDLKVVWAATGRQKRGHSQHEGKETRQHAAAFVKSGKSFRRQPGNLSRETVTRSPAECLQRIHLFYRCCRV